MVEGVGYGPCGFGSRAGAESYGVGAVEGVFVRGEESLDVPAACAVLVGSRGSAGRGWGRLLLRGRGFLVGEPGHVAGVPVGKAPALGLGPKTEPFGGTFRIDAVLGGVGPCGPAGLPVPGQAAAPGLALRGCTPVGGHRGCS